MMLEFQIMNRLRFHPRKIETLERKIEQDKEELQRVRNDLIYETQQTGFLRRRERTLVRRIEANTIYRDQLRIEVLKLRQRLAEVIQA